jgi:hypothetical protein
MMKFKKYCNDNLGWILFIGVFLWIISAYAGTNNLTSVPAGKFKRSHINQYYTALGEDLLPRNSSGTITTRGGSLGDSTRDWLKAHVASGGWEVGDIKIRHTYNGTAGLGCGQGWMQADGTQINEANYNAEHSAGDWDTYIVSSPLDALYTPNMTGRMPIGAATTTETGVGAIALVGDADNQLDLSHTHTISNHDHAWYDWVSTSSSGQSWASTGASVNIGHNTCTGGNDWISAFTTVDNDDCLYTSTGTGDFHTSATAITPSTELSATQTIQNASIEFVYCIRIIN